jgi:4'-phosphopantetheinyl transferase
MTRDESPWCAAPRGRIALGSREVDVWRFALQPGEARLAELLAALSADELDRADQFAFAERRRAFVAARGTLREILSRYVGVTPAEMAFVYDATGKPALAPSLAASGLRFNLAHSGDCGACAVALDGELGIDVERVRPLDNAAAIVARYFSPAEQAAWLQLKGAEQPAAFLRAWTRKEAYLKALGDGLRAPLSQFTVTLAPGEPALLLVASPHDRGAWSIADLPVAEDYAAALVAPADFRVARYWQ